MKYLPILILFLSLSTLKAQISLSGKITDGETGEELIAANINLYKSNIFITGTASDFEGNYSMMLDPGTYDVEVSYVGYSENRINGVIVRAGQKNKLDVALHTGISLDEIVVVDYKVPLVEQDNTTSAAVVTGEKIRKFANENMSSVAASTAGMKAVDKGDGLSVRGSRNKANDVYADGIRVSPTTKPGKSGTDSPPPVAMESAGQLTTGEWKDLDNWSFWEKLMKNRSFSKYKKQWGYSPEQRFSVKLSDEQGRAQANVTVRLLNEKEEVVWNSLTDNKGQAELWGNFFSGNDKHFQLQIQQEDYKHTFEAIPYEKGLNSISLPLTCKVNKEVDIAFVVDATNSMLDEIAYLKAEITDVLQRAEEENEISLRSSAVFYTDRHNPVPFYQSLLTEDHATTIQFIKEQKNSSGGREWAEAPDLGLAKAIREMDWNEEAIARIVFLILDAPPHNKEEFLQDLQVTIQTAARKGIKIIPVAASGIKKDAEFILKFFAMATNGTYTFLTDHSGIGNSHIKPEAGDYNIETLNDMLVRLIGENSNYHDCAPVEDYVAKGVQKTRLKRKERKNKDIKALIRQIKCFPNPATDYVFVDMSTSIDLLLITTADGKTIEQLPKLEAGQIKLNTSKWTGGAYFFHFYNVGKHIVEKIVISRK